MATVYWIVIIMLTCSLVVSAQNITMPSGPAGTPPHGPMPERRPLGAIASFIKMIFDLPMGLVEVLKDGADALEAFVVALMRGLL